MSKSSTFREQRRVARAARRRRQRLVAGGALAVLLLAIAFLVYQANRPEPAAAVPTGAAGEEVTTASGLKYIEQEIGQGEPAKSGDQVQVHYTGYLTDGTKFDSSLDRGTPLPFTIGSGNVIPGWEEGITGMRLGGKRQLIIPPNLAYGSAGAGSVIPPNATLIFDVELVGLNGAAIE